MKPLSYSLVISILLLAATAYGAERYPAAAINPVSAENRTVYESVIMPWLNDEFLLNSWVSANGAHVDRTLVKSSLLKYERLDGQSRYSVHIEYSVSVRESGRVILDGLKGQEIVFFVVDGKVTDYFPFDEYWIKGGVEEQALASIRM